MRNAVTRHLTHKLDLSDMFIKQANGFGSFHVAARNIVRPSFLTQRLYQTWNDQNEIIYICYVKPALGCSREHSVQMFNLMSSCKRLSAEKKCCKLTRVSVGGCWWHSVTRLRALMWQVRMKMWITSNNGGLAMNGSVGCRRYWRCKAAACARWI